MFPRLACLAVILFGVGPASAAGVAERPPSIVIVTSDAVGWDDFACLDNPGREERPIRKAAWNQACIGFVDG